MCGLRIVQTQFRKCQGGCDGWHLFRSFSTLAQAGVPAVGCGNPNNPQGPRLELRCGASRFALVGVCYNRRAGGRVRVDWASVAWPIAQPSVGEVVRSKS